MTIQPLSNKNNETINKNDSRETWWHQSIVKRTTSFVDNDMKAVMRFSPFLRETKPQDTIALFHRSEIQTGRLLGKGGFSLVYEVTGFELDPKVSNKLTLQQQQMRLACVENCTTGGGSEYRYALKHLQSRLLQRKPKEFHCAAADLALEAAYLSRMDHPHILSARGLPVDGTEAFQDGNHDGYFILSDRLGDTLDQRIQSWEMQLENMNDDSDRVNDNAATIQQKSAYALQLAQALEYLHERRIVFRDLKPHNIGFTASEDKLQLFDFGLCRELPDEKHFGNDNNEDVYEMSGVGTRRYMATEIINYRRYNCKADVYSFSIIFWEMLSLTKPYENYGFEEHAEYVCCGGERPKIDGNWSVSIRNILEQSWTETISERLTMKQVACLLRAIVSCPSENTNKKTRSLMAPDSPVSTALWLDVSLMSNITSLLRTSSLQKESGDGERRQSAGGLSLPTISATGWELDDELSISNSLLLSDKRSRPDNLDFIFSERANHGSSIPDLMITSSSSFEGMEVTFAQPQRAVTI